MAQNKPNVIATTGHGYTGGYRLVHRERIQSTWPNTSDLELEREEKDAMGETRWVRVDGWCLSPVKHYDLISGKAPSAAAVLALKMLLDKDHEPIDER